METRYLVYWDYEYVSHNCDNCNEFETLEDAQEFINRNRQYNSTFCAEIWERIGGHSWIPYTARHWKA